MSMKSMFVPLLVLGLSIPLSLFMWLGNITFSKLWLNDLDELNVIAPTRWLFAICFPLLLMLIGLRRQSVSYSGAFLGLIMAFLAALANHAFLICLATFFFTSSRATKYKAKFKAAFEKDFKGGQGRRNWVQVFCNGGMATQLVIMYIIDCGCNERPIDFIKDYRASWLGIAILSAYACCNGDTWASELGSVWCTGKLPRLVTTMRRVPVGTNGAVSTIGLLFSFLGGISVGLAYFITVRLSVSPFVMAAAPPQWPLILLGGLAGLFGSFVDSVLGATLQYSGIDKQGKICDTPGAGIQHINGWNIIDNHSVNLISSIITAITIPMISMRYWPEL